METINEITSKNTMYTIDIDYMNCKYLFATGENEYAFRKTFPIPATNDLILFRGVEYVVEKCVYWHEENTYLITLDLYK